MNAQTKLISLKLSRKGPIECCQLHDVRFPTPRKFGIDVCREGSQARTHAIKGIAPFQLRSKGKALGLRLSTFPSPFVTQSFFRSPRVRKRKFGPYPTAHTYIASIWEYPPPPPPGVRYHSNIIRSCLAGVRYHLNGVSCGLAPLSLSAKSVGELSGTA